jgi:phage major head subunit gpT-like protein
MSLYAWTDLAKSTLPGMQTAFMGGYEAMPVKWPQFAVKIPSTMKIETYPWIADTKGPQEWFAERLPGGGQENYLQVTNKDYEVSWKVDRDALRYEKYGQMRMQATAKGRALARYTDELCLTLFANALTTLSYAGDGTTGTTMIVSDTHSEGASGTQDNKLAGALADGTLTAARLAMMKFKSADGKPLGLVGDTLVVPPDLEKTALTLVQSERIVGSLNNDINIHRDAYRVVVNPFMSDANDWILLCTTGHIMPMIWQEFQGPSAVSMIEDALLTKKYAVFGSWSTPSCRHDAIGGGDGPAPGREGVGICGGRSSASRCSRSP